MKTLIQSRTLTITALIIITFLLYLADKNLNSYQIQILNLIAINAILALSLNLIYGFTGMFSLGHAGFMAIGAYLTALLSLPIEHKMDMWIIEPITWPFSVIEMPFIPSLILAGLVAAFFGFLIAIVILRLGGDYLGIATLGFSEIIRVLLVNAVTFTNGALGIKGIPPNATLFINYGFLFIVIFFLVKLIKSNFGNIFKSIRDDEIAAKVMGINTFQYKTLSFTIGAFFAGIGGGLLGSLLTTIDPKMFTFLLTFNILMIVVAGGLGSLTGSILGSIIITILLEWLRAVESPITIGEYQIPGVPGMRMVVFSLTLLAIILYKREGIMGIREFSWTPVLNLLLRKNVNKSKQL